jgi:hypothetical protein
MYGLVIVVVCCTVVECVDGAIIELFGASAALSSIVKIKTRNGFFVFS